MIPGDVVIGCDKKPIEIQMITDISVRRPDDYFPYINHAMHFFLISYILYFAEKLHQSILIAILMDGFKY